MNKFYDAANIISVFFFMPVLIFLAYHAKTTARMEDPQAVIRPEFGAQQFGPQQGPQLNLNQPNIRPDLNIRPEEGLGQGVGQQPELQPVPEQPQQPQQPNRPGIGRRPSQPSYPQQPLRPGLRPRPYSPGSSGPSGYPGGYSPYEGGSCPSCPGQGGYPQQYYGDVYGY